MELYFFRILSRPSFKVCKAKVLQEKYKKTINKSYLKEKTIIRRQSINLLATQVRGIRN
jgi:hypothetical protein